MQNEDWLGCYVRITQNVLRLSRSTGLYSRPSHPTDQRLYEGGVWEIMELTKYEMETIYNYNQEEPFASCYTMDKALIRRMDALAEKHKEITVLRADEGVREYTFPKKWLKVRAPKELSDQQRENMAKRSRERFGFAKEGDNSEQE